MILSLTTQSALEWNSALQTPALHGSTPWCPYQRAGFDCFFKIWRSGGRDLDPQQSYPLTFEFVPMGLFGLDFNLAGTTAIKESTTEMSEVRVCWQHEKRKIINLNYFLFLLWWLLVFHSCSVEVNRCTISRNFHTLATAIFTRDQLPSIKNLASHALRSVWNIQTPQRFLAMKNTLFLLHQMFSLK